MNNKELNIALGKLFNGLELKGEKYEFELMERVESQIEKAEKKWKEAQSDLKKAKDTLDRTLTLVEINLPPNLKNAYKAAKELGANEIVNKLDKIESKRKEIVKQAMPLYKSI